MNKYLVKLFTVKTSIFYSISNDMNIKKIILLLVGIMLTNYIWAQHPQNCKELKIELDKLKEENEYLRNSLNLNKSINVINADNIEFKLLKAEGNAQSQTITCTLVLTTHAPNWYINSSVKSIIDINGNEYKLKSHTIGAKSYGAVALNTGVPIKCTYTFRGVLPSVKIIKLFKFEYTHSAGEPFYVEFRDITIDWQ